ncbi:MAG: hypothetical protein ACYDAQ_02395 [Mycobacteriales bacterium]
MTTTEDLQIASTALAAVAAVGAWAAATASRESARQTRIGHLIRLHTDRLAVLRQLHGVVSWLTEGGKQRTQRPMFEQLGVKLGIAPGTTIVEGVELRGLVAATGVALPHCHEVCDQLQRMDLRSAPVGEAEKELRVAIDFEVAQISALEKNLRRRPFSGRA